MAGLTLDNLNERKARVGMEKPLKVINDLICLSIVSKDVIFVFADQICA